MEALRCSVKFFAKGQPKTGKKLLERGLCGRSNWSNRDAPPTLIIAFVPCAEWIKIVKNTKMQLCRAKKLRRKDKEKERTEICKLCRSPYICFLKHYIVLKGDLRYTIWDVILNFWSLDLWVNVMWAQMQDGACGSKVERIKVILIFVSNEVIACCIVVLSDWFPCDRLNLQMFLTHGPRRICALDSCWIQPVQPNWRARLAWLHWNLETGELHSSNTECESKC
jgi:hypothetical protein